MNTIDLAVSAPVNRFSWGRVMKIAGYYKPALRTQLILYPLVALVSGLSAGFAMKYPHTGILTGLLVTAMVFMLYWGPTVFSRKSSRQVEVMLPALASEKATFIILYCMVFLPLLIGVPYNIGEAIMELLLGLGGGEMFNGVGNLKVWTIEHVQELIPLVTCMYVVFRCKTSRTSKGILYSILSLVALGVIGGLLAFVMVVADIPYTEPQLLGKDLELKATIDNINAIIGVIAVVYVAVMIWLTCRTIKRIQL
jgi:membrane protein